MASLSRKTAVAASVTVVPLVAAAEIWAPAEPWRWLAPAWGLLAICGCWAITRGWAHRVSTLTTYASELGDSETAKPRLQLVDDELGQLARTLSRTAPTLEKSIQDLRAEVARRDAILASMTEAVLAVDAKLNVSFSNDSFVRVAGHPVAAGVPLIKVFRDPGLFQMLRNVIDSGETMRARLNLSVQEDRWFEVYATPLTGSQPRGALAILHDVTPMARIERAHRDFVANVSHEFRTPLATITGCAETLLHGAWDDPQNRRRFLEIIQANSIRLTNIAADLITLSQLDAGRPRSGPEPIAVEDVISSALRAIEPVAGMRGVAVSVEQVCAAQILGYRLAFEQALVNLLDNAIKFNHPSGVVVVRAVAQNDDVEVSVTDTGAGIPADDLSRIFERFYRVDKARTRETGGTGLGLSIVRQAVEQMHGTVRVDSQLGHGSCFTIHLPRYHGAPSS